MQERQLAGHRAKTVQSGTVPKNQMRAILPQNRIRIRGDPFSRPRISRVREPDSFRIDDRLGIIYYISYRIARAGLRIRDAVADNPDAVLL